MRHTPVLARSVEPQVGVLAPRLSFYVLRLTSSNPVPLRHILLKLILRVLLFDSRHNLLDFIRGGDKVRHRASMITALALSALFLVFYVIYKANSGFAKFGGVGTIRPVYFTILIIHVIGAVAPVLM